MKTSSIFLGLIAIILLIVFWAVSNYNNLIKLNEQVDASWAQVETQYQRRFDLIPNLVESTKGFLTQEQEVFSDIAQARTGYAGAKTTNEKIEATGELESSLARLLVIVENYPALQSNQTVMALMDELAGTENRISVERKRFNDIVQVYNTKIKSIPTVFFASIMGFEERNFFEAVESANQAPKVNLDLE